MMSAAEVGMLVWYFPTDDEYASWRLAAATTGGSVSPRSGAAHPAIVTGVSGSLANLRVFVDGTTLPWVCGVSRAEDADFPAPGTWVVR